MFESPLSHFCQLLTICAMCLWFGNGMKLYPCSPGYVKGTPAAMAASWWTCCCCCTLVRFPSTGIWYPVGMLMFRSKKKFPNPVCDAGILSVYVPSCYSGLSGVPPTPCDYLYTTSCRAVWEGATGCGVGCVGGGGGVLTDSYVQKTQTFHWQQIPSKEPSAVPFSVFFVETKTCAAYHSDHWRI